MSYRSSWLGVIICFSVALAGCTTVRSDRRPNFAADPSQAGMTYFLPTRMMRLTATRTKIELPKAQRDVVAAESALVAARAAEAEAKDRRDAAQRLLATAVADATIPDAHREVLRSANSVAQAAFTTAERRRSDGDTALDNARQTLLTLLSGGAACTFAARIELLPAQADPEYRFIARPVHSPLRDDTTKLRVNANGLLSSANVVAADRTGDIIVEVAGAIAAFGGRAGFLAAERTDDTASCEGPAQFVTIFDPQTLPAVATEAPKSGSVNETLVNSEFPFRLTRSALVSAPGELPACTGTPAEVLTCRSQPQYHDFIEADPADMDGALYYRSPIPVTVMIHQRRPDSTCPAVAPVVVDPATLVAVPPPPPGVVSTAPCYQPVEGAVVMLPQAGPVTYVPMNSSAFVRTVNDVQFTDGVITSWDSERPSEVLEIVRLPVRILTAIISVPAQIFTLRINRNDTERSLIESQRLEIEQATRWRIIQTCIDRAADDTASLACLTTGD